jgi:hypothetical protein
MAEATNPMDANAANAMHAASAPPRAQATPVATTRPGLVTFAGVMMFILGGFQLTWAIVEFSNAAWLSGTVYGTFNGYLWLWAILDLLLAGVSFYAGYDILRGGTFGYVYGALVAGLSAIRWFFYLPAAPAVGIVVIALDILIIYGLVANSDYFRESPVA